MRHSERDFAVRMRGADVYCCAMASRLARLGAYLYTRTADHRSRSSMSILHSDALPVLRLKRGEDRRIRAGHLWVFSNEIDNAARRSTGFAPGAASRVRLDRDQFLGYAYVNPHALICARIVGRDLAQPLDRALIERAAQGGAGVARAPRQRALLPAGVRRVGRLPGLVLDRYGDVIVGQIATAGMEALKADVEAAVREVAAAARRCSGRTTPAARDLEQLPQYAEVAFGTCPMRSRSSSRGCAFRAPLRAGPEDRLVLRSDRQPAATGALSAPGARVLDVCSYVGAWAVTALTQRRRRSALRRLLAARAATSRSAMRAANGSHAGDDARRCLRCAEGSCTRQGERFDVVILDPPAFIKRKKDIPQGQAAYRKLNQLALS